MLTLDRWIALCIIILFTVYGYTAWFVMDDLLPPILRFNPIWPSSFPKILSILGVGIALILLLGAEKNSQTDKEDDIDYRKWRTYHVKTTLALIGLMVAYAVLLRPLGFLGATILFLTGSGWVLGEQRLIRHGVISAIASGGIWYLVDAVLGIYLRPYPQFIMSMMEG